MLVLVVFILVYLYLVVFKRRRAVAIWCGILIIVFFSVLRYYHVITRVNWNVIGIFAGTLVLAEFFSFSRVPAFLSDILIGRSKSTGSAMLRVCIMSGFLSVFIENVAVVLITAPIALEVIKKLKVSPVPMLIGIAVASNLQGTATLIGDPPSMILAGQLKMSFNDFFVYHGNLGVFFAVEFSAFFSFLVLYFFFRKNKEPVVSIKKTSVTSWTPTVLLCLMVVGLAIAPIFDKNFLWLSGTICTVFAVISIIWGISFNKKEVIHILRRYDWDTTFFLAGIFVLVSAFEDVGLIVSLKNLLVNYLGSDIFLSYLFIILFSVAVSAVIDNVPFITLMIPVTHEMGLEIGSEYLLVFGLLIGTCMGGNITPVGAAANIVSVGILRREGHPVSFWSFMKIGLPYTIAATVSGAAFIWLVWR
ncbi:hypothetical protein AMJ80_04640 [bacterium SM23_31]|nr:MAG: hypothetical protein AMJ80_04640 [bacterium SM23_31]